MPNPSSNGGSTTHSRSGSVQSRTETKSRGSAKSGTSKASISITLPNPAVQQEHDGLENQVNIRGVSAERHHQMPMPDIKSNQQPHYGSTENTNYHPPSGTIPPQGTPTRSGAIRALSDEEVKKILAARIIERTWMAFRDRQMFKLLKHAVCAAEHSLSTEILRKVCPKEATLLNDKSMSIRVRFRFGGREFPPMIYFKIYSSVGEGAKVKYVSGKQMIKPASEAAQDACNLMGNRKFYEQMIQDMLQQEKFRVTSETDITTLKDYMQYLSHLDEIPAYMGGRDNSWRKLTLEVVPRQTIFYDVVDFLYSQEMSPLLQQELPVLVTRPITQDAQIEHMRIISSLHPLAPLNTPKTKLSSALSQSQNSSRRSRQARQRALRMKRMYDMQAKENQDPLLIKEATFETVASQVRIEEVPQVFGEGDVEEDWEEEAEKLYEWTQELSFEELAPTTPRIHSNVQL